MIEQKKSIFKQTRFLNILNKSVVFFKTKAGEGVKMSNDTSSKIAKNHLVKIMVKKYPLSKKFLKT